MGFCLWSLLHQEPVTARTLCPQSQWWKTQRCRAETATLLFPSTLCKWLSSPQEVLCGTARHGDSNKWSMNSLPAVSPDQLGTPGLQQGCHASTWISALGETLQWVPRTLPQEHGSRQLHSLISLWAYCLSAFSLAVVSFLSLHYCLSPAISPSLQLTRHLPTTLASQEEPRRWLAQASPSFRCKSWMATYQLALTPQANWGEKLPNLLQGRPYLGLSTLAAIGESVDIHTGHRHLPHLSTTAKMGNSWKEIWVHGKHNPWVHMPSHRQVSPSLFTSRRDEPVYSWKKSLH